MKKITDINLKDKKVLLRCDLNVPIKDGKILDDTRLKKSLKTIEYCLNKNCKLIIFSHLGRVKEEKDLKEKSLKPVAKRLQQLLDKKVIFVNETRGKKLEEKVNKLRNGEILLVENTRFEDLEGKKESKNDPELAKYWANLGDVFINDAFGTIHREHASNVGIATNVESAIGFLIDSEINALSSLNEPDKPFIIILGGAKVEDKIGVIENLIKKADYILLGGGMANTFLNSEGFKTGSSLIDHNSLDFCTKILKEYPNKIILPIDINCSTEFSNDSPNKEKNIIDINENEMALDVGEKTIELYKKYLCKAKTVLWNGPLGVYELSKYKKSTDEILNYLVDNNIKTILGGGDIVAAATNAKVEDKIYHVSTGGGATLEYLEGKKLPGLEAIK